MTILQPSHAPAIANSTLRSMRFQIQPTEGEFARACNAMAQAALPPSRSTPIVVGLYVLVILAAFALTPSTWLPTALIGMGAVLVTSLALEAEGRARIRRVQREDTHALETHYVELNGEGVRSWCAHNEARCAWSDLIKVTENDEFFVFLRTGGNGSSLPKRLLDADMDAELRAQLREWAAPGTLSLRDGKQ